MFGHFPELVIVLVLALIVFGPDKVPEMAASAGKMMREFRELMDDAMHQPEAEVPDDFSSYYYESLARNGEEVPEGEQTEVYRAELAEQEAASGPELGAHEVAAEKEPPAD